MARVTLDLTKDISEGFMFSHTFGFRDIIFVKSLSMIRSIDLPEWICFIEYTDSVDLTKFFERMLLVVWLKVELCRLLEEKRSAILRSEELETALMEMVKQDNRRQLSARVEQLEQEVAELRMALSEKQEQENAMLQVLMRVEQDQRVTEDARRFAEQDAAAQRYAVQVLQEKYEEATASLAEMEKRVVMAESMLEATLQYQSGQSKVQPSPRSSHPDSSARSNQEPQQEIPARKISILSRPFGLGWRDRNKGKPGNVDGSNDGKPSNEGQNTEIQQKDTNDKETNGKDTNEKELNGKDTDDKGTNDIEGQHKE
ncbi:TBC1 domain family member 8B-like isoform X1 [Gossypium australe]|uniref:TBC1 domain family member 8B-like isoform X1 n=1 Tax=Gossypium australe TaxID=47621 RepID=A0A5B6WIS3_9ROSI|nr:TBC1 domain family member 8B-like isoform X1 [Gossypium australe]